MDAEFRIVNRDQTASPRKNVEQLSQLLQEKSINKTGTASVSQTPFADK
jgi:hypothetical protein